MKSKCVFLSSSAKFFFVLVFMVVVCGGMTAQSDADKPSTEKAVVIEKQANQTISVRPGDVVTVKLSVQMGTGYSWQLSSANRKVAKLEGQPEVVPNGEARPGGSGTQVFRVRILRSGTAHLLLQYIRPWEKHAEPAKKFRVTLHAGAKEK